MRQVLFCAPTAPAHDREGGGARTFNWILLLRSAGFGVRFWAAGQKEEDFYLKSLSAEGIEAWAGVDEAAFRRAAADRADWVVVCFWRLAEQLMGSFREALPGARILVDSVDLHLLRKVRGAFCGAESDGLIDPDFGQEIVRELNVYAAADGVLAVSGKEARMIGDLIGDRSRIFNVPLCQTVAGRNPAPSRRRGVLFLGNFLHPPNQDALSYLCREIWDRVDANLRRKHPLSVIGNALTDRIGSLAAGLSEVKVVGWDPDLATRLTQARLCLVPLRYGAGAKQKVIESLAAGTPVVSTPTGTEGLGLRHRRDVWVADSARSFAVGIERLLRDGPLWRRLSENGRDRVSKRHSPQYVTVRLKQAFESVEARAARDAQLAQGCRERARTWFKNQYDQLLDRVRAAVDRNVPAGAQVLVISKGDPRLLELEGRPALHFPSDTDGDYPGYYPENDGVLIEQLEAKSRLGARYLVVPAPYFWWLDHYRSFGAHLASTGRKVWESPDACVVFALGDGSSSAQEAR